jgi:hypothetical protein
VSKEKTKPKRINFRRKLINGKMFKALKKC